jgi:hypothetical protein
VTPKDLSARIAELEARDRELRTELEQIGMELDGLYVGAALSAATAKINRQHVWRATSLKDSRCARCGVTRRRYGNGSSQYRALSGRTFTRSPACTGATP